MEFSLEFGKLIIYFSVPLITFKAPSILIAMIIVVCFLQLLSFLYQIVYHIR